jgi:hypothetical protein
MLSRPTLSKSAVSFSPFVSLLVAFVELAIANLSLFYCSGSQHLTCQQAIAHSTNFSLLPGQLLAQQAIADLMLSCLPTSPQLLLEQAIAAVVGKGSLFWLQALCAPDKRVF